MIAVCRNLKIYSLLILVFLFLFATIHPKYFSKSHLFLKFYMLRERSSDIASFVEHPAFSNLKMYDVLIFLFLICFATFCPKSLCKSYFLEILGALLSWSTLYIAFSRCIVSLYYFFYFVLPCFTQKNFCKVIFS